MLGGVIGAQPVKLKDITEWSERWSTPLGGGKRTRRRRCSCWSVSIGNVDHRSRATMPRRKIFRLDQSTNPIRFGCNMLSQLVNVLVGAK